MNEDRELTDVQAAVRQTFADFADRVAAPAAMERDAKGEFPRDLFRDAGRLGLFGMRYPAEVGGGGADMTCLCLAIEELGRGWLSLAACSLMQSLMGTWFVWRSRNDDLYERLLRPAILGDLVGTICMTEPDAGSDLRAISTRAAPDGDGYRLSGRKTWITNAPAADFFTVFAQAPGGLSTFIVEASSAGVSVGRAIEKMGLRSSPTSEVSFEDVRVPASHRVGREGQGAEFLGEVIPWIRTATAALSLGVARAAFDAARKYAGQRRQFGRAIGEFQAIQFKLADMATDIEASRALVRTTARAADRGELDAAGAAICKNFATEAALRVCEDASRILASYGYSTEYPVERYLRDVRFTLIGGGTPEMLKLAIAKAIPCG